MTGTTGDRKWFDPVVPCSKPTGETSPWPPQHKLKPIAATRCEVQGPKPSLERLRDLLTFHQHVAQVERVVEHPVDPLAVDRRIGSVAVLVLIPLLLHLPQRLGMLRVVGVHPLRETLDEHRQTQERSRDLDERQPFGVVLGDGHCLRAQDQLSSSPLTVIFRSVSVRLAVRCQTSAHSGCQVEGNRK